MQQRTEYVVGDALSQLEEMPAESAKVVCLDDAWARPKRGGEFGVTYPTHDFEMTTEIIDACWRVLQSDGWLIADADDWLQPQLVEYLSEEYGNIAEDYDADEGYRRVGGVTYVKSNGEPNCGGAGQYLRNAGYSVVFAHKADAEQAYAAARQVVERQSETYGWGSVKPVLPYQNWLDELCEPGEHVAVPCAGTAPAAIAAERLGLSWTAIDCEPEAREAFERRRDDELQTTDEQSTIPEVAP